MYVLRCRVLYEFSLSLRDEEYNNQTSVFVVVEILFIQKIQQKHWNMIINIRKLNIIDEQGIICTLMQYSNKLIKLNHRIVRV